MRDIQNRPALFFTIYPGLVWSPVQYSVRQPVMVCPGLSCPGTGKRGQMPSPGATCMHRLRIKGVSYRTVRSSLSRCCGRDRNQGQLQAAPGRKSNDRLLLTLNACLRLSECTCCDGSAATCAITHLRNQLEDCVMRTIEGHWALLIRVEISRFHLVRPCSSSSNCDTGSDPCA